MKGATGVNVDDNGSDLTSAKECTKSSVSMLEPFSRIRRNLSIHIARFSASESPRAIYQHSQKSPIFAGSWLIA